jgi:serine/threonine protein phosphatase 1
MGLIAIGDIHGCARTLDTLLEAIDPGEDTHLVFIGDYLDRGPDSRGVIDRLIALEGRCECTFLRGNHEALCLDYLDHGADDLWFMNGGLETLRSYQEGISPIVIPDDHREFLRKTRMYLETDDFVFVHAGLKATLTVEENLSRNDPDVFLWERSHLHADEYAWEKAVVCGHTPVEWPVNTPHLINIDTGCVYSSNPMLGKMTAVYLPEREFVSIPNVESWS